MTILKLVIILKIKKMTDKEIFNCVECGENFLKFTIDPDDEWDFLHLIHDDDTLCKGCIYKLLMEYYREKVWAIEDLVENW